MTITRAGHLAEIDGRGDEGVDDVARLYNLGTHKKGCH